MGQPISSRVYRAVYWDILSDIGGNPTWAADVKCAESAWTLARVLRVSVAELVHEIGTL
jgi:hypothetical protein